MKKLLLAPILLFISAVALGQYGNEWINYSQQYLKISIVQDGVYRIDSTELSDALSTIGIDLATTDPQRIQLYGRETQQYIHVEGESDGVFDGTDYIEFYGLSNDGWYDLNIYDNPSDQNNPYYSHFNDTATYYLTVDIMGTTSNRMIQETDTAFSSYTEDNYFWAKSWWEGHSRYYQGPVYNSISVSRVTDAEGWFDADFGATTSGNSKSKTVQTPNVYIGGPDALVEVTCATTNDPETDTFGYDNQDITLEWGTGNVFLDTSFRGYALLRKNFTIANSNLSASTIFKWTTTTHMNNAPGANGRLAIGHATMIYPHSFDMGNASSYKMLVDSNSQGKSEIAFSNFNGSSPMLYSNVDGAIRRIPVEFNAGLYRGLIPNENASQTSCFLFDDATVTNITAAQMNPVTANNGYFTDFTTVTFDSAYVIVTHVANWNEALAYAAYRDQTGFNSLVVDVDELYHQFGAGIVKHPEGVKDFFDYAYDNWPTPPSHIFLLGKSVRAQGQPTNTGSRTNTYWYERNHVPSYGYPASDIMYVSDLDNDNDLEPEISIGRLSPEFPSEITEYLSKVQEYEAVGEEEWRKHILHFGGGATTDEQVAFAAYLNVFEQSIEDTLYGGFVHTFLKESSAPIEINLSDSVRDLIEGGVSFMTFFGHASGSGFDQSIDDPNNYNNQGKYPFVIANSCYSGDMHEPDYFSTAENYVLIPNKGMIGFLASVKQGLDVYLYLYSSALYRNLASLSYGDPIGEVINHTIRDMDGSNGYPLQEENVCLSMNLHCDPAIKLYATKQPDFQIDATDVWFDPGTITADVDSFEIFIELTNIGMGITDSISVEITRHFPNGEDTVYIPYMQGLLYKDTLSITLPVDELRGLGLNSFDVRVDLPTFIEELPGFEVINNEVYGVDLMILTGGIVPIYPYEYAIIPDSVVTLKASTGDLWASNTDFIFEMDTTDEFNSPFKISEVVNNPGGVVEWVPKDAGGNPVILTDSTVYFWRATSDTLWRESSFQYIRGRRGWGQAHFFQFKNDDYNLIDYNRTFTNRTFDFAPEVKALQVIDYGWDVGDVTVEDLTTGYSIDGAIQDESGCDGFAPALHLVIIDSATLQPWRTYGWTTNSSGVWTNQNHQFGNANNGLNCNSRNRTEGFFVYKQHVASQMTALETTMLDTIPDGTYIALYSWGYMVQQRMTSNPNIGAAMASLGAQNFSTTDSVPYIFFVKKGYPNTAIEVWGTDKYDRIELNTVITANFPSGTISTPVAGPAKEWNSLHWAQHAQELNSEDSTSIMLFGRTAQGIELLLGEFDVGLDSVIDLDTYIDADQYPFARLVAFTQDDSSTTPAQLERWQLVYTPVPEAALNPSAGLMWPVDSVAEGQTLDFAIAIENISEFDMDSLLVHYWVEDKDRVRNDIPYARQAPLLSGDILYDTITINTVDFPGQNYLWVEVNPVNPLDTTNTGYDQLEQFHFNNLAVRSFNVSVDRINPILDVTYDGIHIIDGEVISANPYITMTLDDENPYLIMDQMADTANFTVWLTDPNGNQERVFFQNGLGEEIMVFTPADGIENKCRIDYNPTLTVDGIYQLYIQAKDKSDNESGSIDYRGNFEIITRSTVTEVLNYPNPFSTSTRFVFTLTGSEPPTYFKIQIMTVTGRVVREIYQDELGPLRIGRNMTEFAWDGTDEFGDPLANGIYLYRVVVKDANLDDVEYRETSASKYFKKGLGKMYLMR